MTWTPEQDRELTFLRRAGMTQESIAEDMNRSRSAIRRRIAFLIMLRGSDGPLPQRNG